MDTLLKMQTAWEIAQARNRLGSLICYGIWWFESVETMDISILRPFDAAEFLRDEGDMTSYLAAAFEEGDADLIRSALNDVARARGMTALARDTGLTRETLYKALGDKGNPTLTTLLAISKALGVKLSVAA